jgi:hypothetical protein
MAIAITLQQYLEDHDVRYDVLVHQRTVTARQTARTCAIPKDRLAKAVLMRDRQGYVVAVLPASCRLDKVSPGGGFPAFAKRFLFVDGHVRVTSRRAAGGDVASPADRRSTDRKEPGGVVITLWKIPATRASHRGHGACLKPLERPAE